MAQASTPRAHYRQVLWLTLAVALMASAIVPLFMVSAPGFPDVSPSEPGDSVVIALFFLLCLTEWRIFYLLFDRKKPGRMLRNLLVSFLGTFILGWVQLMVFLIGLLFWFIYTPAVVIVAIVILTKIFSRQNGNHQKTP